MTKQERIDSIENIIRTTKWDMLSGGGARDVAIAIEESISLDPEAIIEEFGMYFQENSETDVGDEGVQIDLADLISTNKEIIKIEKD